MVPETLPYPAITTTAALVFVVVFVIALLVVLRRWSEPSADYTSPVFVLSLIIIIGFVSITAYAARTALPESEAAGQLLGGLISGFALVIGYWFGPRRGGGAGP